MEETRWIEGLKNKCYPDRKSKTSSFESRVTGKCRINIVGQVSTAVFKMNARRTNMQFELRLRGKIEKSEESADGLLKARILL